MSRTYAALFNPTVASPLDAALGTVSPSPRPFSNRAAVLGAGPGFVEQLFDFAEEATHDLSPEAIAPDACSGSTVTRACATNVIATFGARAFRRPLVPGEAEAYLRAFDDAQAQEGSSGADSLRWALRRVAVAPPVLFRSELGSPDGKGGFQLTAAELATAMAYTISNAPPDAQLTAAAASGALDAKAIEAHAKRLLASPAAASGVLGFLMELAEVSPQGLADQVEETRRFLTDVLWTGDARLATLLTAKHTFVNAALAKAYWGMNDGFDGWKKVVPADARAGLLTQGSVLATVRTRSARGKFVRERFLCEPPIVVPEGINTNLEAQRGDAEQQAGRPLTEEELRALHTSKPACVGCHKLIDPVGAPFNRFDKLGVPLAASASVDTRGRVPGLDGADVELDDVVGLGRALASSPQVRRCFVQRAFEYAQGRAPSELDHCAIDALAKRFDESGGDVRRLFVDLFLEPSATVRAATP